MQPTRRPDVMARNVKDELVILDRRMGQVHRLNSTATFIWAYCDGRHSPEEIAAHVAEAFDQPPDSILRDVVGAIEDLRRLGLLTEHAPIVS